MVERPDNRTENTQLRAFSASQDILNRADGSAKFEFGSTSVIASVNGPIDVSLRDEKLDEATIEVVVRPAKGVSTTNEKLMENTLRTAFEPIILAGMMPRTLIQIVVQILKDDGSALAAAANAITLALLDAGVPMRQMVGSVTCMINETSNELILDPTTIELQTAKSVHTFAFDNVKTSRNALLSDSEGIFSENEYFSTYDLCFEAVQKVHEFLRTAVESKKEKEQQQILGN